MSDDGLVDGKVWLRGETMAAMNADPEKSHRGEVTLSQETTGDHPLCFDWLIADNVAAFFRIMAVLTSVERDVCISYYLLCVSQSRIGKLFGGMGQSAIGQVLLRARNRMNNNGNRTYRSAPKERPVEYRSDPDHVGDFRVDVRHVNDVCGEHAAIRRQSGDY